MNRNHELQYIIETARNAGNLVREQFGKVERLTKRHEEAVTEADRASQRLIVSAIHKRFEGDGIVGEENETGDAITFDCPDPMGRVWVIDPIDGTNNFIAGLGNFAVCIGLLEKGWPVLGVVYDVMRDQMYVAAKGEGAWLDKRKLSALTTPLDNSAMIMMTSNVVDPSKRCPQWAARLVGQTHWKVRILGSAALEAVSVAAGIAHAAITVNGKLWDLVAPAAVVLEAGGVITDLKGKPIFPFDLRNYEGAKAPYLAAGPAAHAGMLREILTHP